MIEYTLSACIRCKKRKRKCDPGLPACKPCAKSGTRCEFYDPAANGPVDREYICKLETRLAALLEEKRKRAQCEASQRSTEKRVDNLISEKIGGKSGEEQFVGQSSGMQLAQLLMDKAQGGTTVPFVAEDVGPSLLDDRPKPSLSLPPMSSFLYLVSLYIEQSEVRYPIFLRSSLMELVANVYHNISRDTHSLCAINLIMAISLQISSRNDLRLIPLAAEYYQEALPYLKETCRDMRDLRTLQCLLLTIVYSLLHPSRVPVWHMAGIAMRMCLDLGLHRDELICQSVSDPLQIDLRRRLWWSKFAIDRGLSLAVGRPLTIPDDSISTQYPSTLEDACIGNRDKIPQINLSKTVTNHWLDLRKLQSEIVGKLYLNSSNSLNSDDPWYKDIYSRFEAWRDNAPVSVPGPLNQDWSMHGFYNGILLMHRPSPANPTPSRESYVTCYEAAAANLLLYRNMIVTKSIDITWLICHYLFVCAITLIYAYYYSKDVRDRYSLAELNDSIKLGSFCLQEITERWPAASGMLKAFYIVSGFVVKAFSPVQISQNPQVGYSEDSTRQDIFWVDPQITGMSEQDILEQIFLGYPYPNEDENVFASFSSYEDGPVI
jgi:hypothetical protein